MINIHDDDFTGFCKLTGSLDDRYTHGIDLTWMDNYVTCSEKKYEIDVNPQIHFDIECDGEKKVKSQDHWDLVMECYYVPREESGQRKYKCYPTKCEEHPDGEYTDFDMCDQECAKKYKRPPLGSTNKELKSNTGLWIGIVISIVVVVVVLIIILVLLFVKRS